MVSLRSVVFVAVSSFALAACGGGSTVAIELTDAPVTLSTIEKVEISFGKVDVESGHSCHGGDHEGARKGGEGEREQWTTVNEKAGTFDLLTLRDGVTAPLGEVEMWGEVQGVRLQIDAAGTNQVVMKDGTICALDTTGVTEASIRMGEGAEVELARGGRTTIVVDFIVEESIEEVSACNFALRPVLAVKSVTHADDDS